MINLADNRDGAWESVSRKEEEEKIKNAILGLPEYQKEVIILKFYHDLKIREIAEITKSNESTVKSRLKQGMAKLRNIMQRGEEYAQV